MCGWDRIEAHAHARKLAAIAELARRNPGNWTRSSPRMSRSRAGGVAGPRGQPDRDGAGLRARLPGTAAALADGTISRYKAEIIAGATALLEDEEARAAEQDVLVRHATCTSPICLRPARTCDFEHNTPYEAGGRTCLCTAGPKCRHDHRLKQHPKWHVEQLPDGTFRWTTPAGRSYDTEPTR